MHPMPVSDPAAQRSRTTIESDGTCCLAPPDVTYLGMCGVRNLNARSSRSVQQLPTGGTGLIGLLPTATNQTQTVQTVLEVLTEVPKQ